jgi:drug/metabolite transporter (DMT)-like permease
MFQGGSIITTLIFSKILINMVIKKRHIWGCALAFVGLLIVGGSGFLGSQGSSGSSVSIKLFREMNFLDIF